MTSYLRPTTVVLAALDLAALTLLLALRPTGASTDGEYGALTFFATVGMGVAAVLLAVIVRPLVSGRFGPLGVGLLVFFGVARVMQAFLPIEALGTIAFLILPIAALCVAFSLRARWSIGLAVALAVALVLVLAWPGGAGLAQRLFLVLGAGWLLVTALSARNSHPAAN